MALLGKAARAFLGPHPPRIHMNSRLWFPCELCELYQCTMCIAHICNQPLNYQTNQYKELLEGNHMNIYCEQFPLDRTNKIYWFVGLLPHEIYPIWPAIIRKCFWMPHFSVLIFLLNLSIICVCPCFVLLWDHQNVSVFCILCARVLTFAKWRNIRQEQYFHSSHMCF